MQFSEFVRSLFFSRTNTHSNRLRRFTPTRRNRAHHSIEPLEARVLLAAPHPLDLSTLDGTNGFRLEGIASSDFAGGAVSGAGDINADGIDDVIVGAPSADPGGMLSAGEAYVVFGRTTSFGGSLDLSTLDGSNGFRLAGGVAGDRLGFGVKGAGDFNGDGIDDLLIGADGADPNGNSQAGQSYVVFGSASMFPATVDVSALDGNDGFRLDGIDQDDLSGRHLNSAGDVNGDGFSDIIIGADFADPPDGADAGEAYVVFGKAGGFGPVVDLSSLDGTTGFRIEGRNENDHFGRSVSSAGDMNGDGVGDLIVGARVGGSSRAGEAYVVFGKTGGFDEVLELSALDGGNGFRLDGISTYDAAGNNVGAAGDINGDGFDDIIIGANYAESRSDYPNAGEIYIVFGKGSDFGPAMSLLELNGTNGFRLDGIASSDFVGAVSTAGDVNGDGFDDLLIGARGADAGGDYEAGETYVLFGKATGFTATMSLAALDGNNGFQLDGVDAGDDAGRSVSSAGDVNGDGFDDLIIGAPYGDPNGENSGESYVVFGGNLTGGIETQVGGDGSDVLRADQAWPQRDILIGGRGDDTLIGDFGDDILRGGAGDDQLIIGDADFDGTRRVQGGNGIDTLRLGRNDTELDLTDIADNRITDIEQIGLWSTDGYRHTLILNVLEVLNLSTHSNTLTVRGSTGTSIILEFDYQREWTSRGSVSIDGLLFEQFTNGAAILNVGTGIQVQFEGSIELSLLNGANGFRLDGTQEGDYAGRSVSHAGDVNGDGFDDVIIGAHGADPGGNASAGAAYVVFGTPEGTPASIDLASLEGTNGFRLDGIGRNDLAGRAVSGAGDVNGDGFDDVIIGAHLANPNGKRFAGESYVVFGAASGFPAVLNLGTLDGANGFRLMGDEEFDQSGQSVNGAGDINGDGFDDLLVGATFAGANGEGKTYLVFGTGQGFPVTLDLSRLDGTNGFQLVGIDVNDTSGWAVSEAGDINGDGFDDLVIGSYWADPGGKYAAGECYVVFGAPQGFPASLNLSSLDGTNGFRLDGINAADKSGFSVSNAGDVNGDGFDDLIVGAATADPGGVHSAGESYVVFGAAGGFPAAIPLESLNGTSGFRLEGVLFGGSAGHATSGAGDVNGDGFDDLIIGAWSADLTGLFNVGESYVVFGSAEIFPAVLSLGALDGVDGFRLAGVDAEDTSGLSVGAAGDMNGDGFDDLIIGAYRADPGGAEKAGEAYVFYGGNFAGGVEKQVGSPNANALFANQGSGAVDILIGGRGNDLLVSDGGDDILGGGEGDDYLLILDADFFGTRRLVGGNGHDTLRLAGSGIYLDLTVVADNRIVDIEQIDLSGSGSNTLTLGLREVLNLSTHSNTLIVRGDADDVVNIDSGWTLLGDELLFGQTFAVYVQGAATLKIEVAVNTTQLFDDIVFQRGDGTWSVAASDGSQFSTNDWANWEAAGVTWVDPISGDFDGDGLQDIAARNLDTGDWYVGLSDGDSFNASPWVRWNANKEWGQIQVADFNGDGRDDIAGRIQDAGDGRWFVSLSTGSSFTFHQHWATWNPNVTWGQIDTGDFNGDGQADIVGRVQDSGDGRWFALISTGSNFQYSNWGRWLTHVEWGGVHIGDFNGDGRDDIAGRIQESDDGRWFLGLSDGAKFNTLVGPNFAPGRALSHELVGDFDGDGDSEIAARLADDGRWFVLNLTGSTLGFRLWATWGTGYQFAESAVGDFNGDGLDDIAARSRFNNRWYVAASDETRFNTSIWGPTGNDDWDYAAAGEFA